MNLILIFSQGVHILFQHLEGGVCVPFGMGQVEQSQKHAEKTLLSGAFDVGTNRWRDLKFIRRQMAKIGRASFQVTNVSAVAHLLRH